MSTWFDEARLDDAAVLDGIDSALRELAESGARVRREAGLAAEARALGAVDRADEAGERPRAVVAAGPDGRLLRAVLEPWCPVPFVAWPGPGLPGWAGGLDLVVVCAPEGSDEAAASAVAEAGRRGCRTVVACPPRSLVEEHVTGRWSTVLPSSTGDALATTVVLLGHLHRLGLGPATDADEVAAVLDEVAVACSPLRDLADNPAKALAIALADAAPLVWGGSVLAARAARRVAEGLRRASGRPVLAGDADHLLPVLASARQRDVFDDPFEDGPARGGTRPVLVVLDDGDEEPAVREQRGRLLAAAAARGVRAEVVPATSGSEVARYASLVLTGAYAAEYLAAGLVSD